MAKWNNRRKDTKMDKPTLSKSGYIEYVMSQQMARNLLKDNTSRVHPQKYLCDVVNNSFGLKGYCTKVIIKG